jgi:hypothetical protein
LEAPEAVRNTIDIDVGGTFTDVVMVVDGETIFRKVPTTPYDLSARSGSTAPASTSGARFRTCPNPSRSSRGR